MVPHSTSCMVKMINIRAFYPIILKTLSTDLCHQFIVFPTPFISVVRTIRRSEPSNANPVRLKDPHETISVCLIEAIVTLAVVVVWCCITPLTYDDWGIDQMTFNGMLDGKVTKVILNSIMVTMYWAL